MKLRIFLVAFSLYGIYSALTVARLGAKEIIPAAAVAEPARSSFAESVAGSGVVEPNTENIVVGSELSGVVSEVLVRPGAEVKKDAVLFSLDTRTVDAEVALRKSQLEVAEADKGVADVVLAEARDNLERINRSAASVVSVEERARRVFAVRAAESQVVRQAGRVAAERENLEAVKVQRELHLIKAPIDGTVLQVKIRPGEFVTAGVGQSGSVVIGNVQPLYVRVDIDENDAWRVKPGAKATIFVRGNTKLSSPGKFVRFEPLVVPKRSLTGDTRERVDTRVLQLVYEVENRDIPLYVGQLVDVFLDAEGNREGGK